jgi:hypothetical protein
MTEVAICQVTARYQLFLAICDGEENLLGKKQREESLIILSNQRGVRHFLA